MRRGLLMPCQFKTLGHNSLYAESNFRNSTLPIKNIKSNRYKQDDLLCSNFKKIISVTILIGALSLPNLSFAKSYSKISDDTEIQKALFVLEGNHADKTLALLNGQNSSHKPIKIMFYSLIMVSPKYADAYAIATADNDGNMYILIDTKYKDEPPEALASLIAHEATHQLAQTTLEEEIQAWTNETLQWIEFKKTTPSLAKLDENKYKLVRRLNYLEKLYVSGNNSSELIAETVIHNKSYRLLSLK